MATGTPRSIKPADLPDLPIRVRIGLLTYPLISVALIGILVLVVSTTRRPADQLPAVALIAALTGLMALLWRFGRAGHIAMAQSRRWWRVKMEQGDDEVRFSWEPQTMADLMPRLAPTVLWPPCVSVAMMAFALVIAQSAPSADELVFLAVSVFMFVPAVGSLAFTTYAAATPKLQSLAVLNGTGASICSPYVHFIWPKIFMYPEAWFRWSAFKLRLRELKSIDFDPTGVGLRERRRNAKRFHGFRIPTRDPDQRRAIADWAGRHDIPTNGAIDTTP